MSIEMREPDLSETERMEIIVAAEKNWQENPSSQKNINTEPQGVPPHKISILGTDIMSGGSSPLSNSQIDALNKKLPDTITLSLHGRTIEIPTQKPSLGKSAELSENAKSTQARIVTLGTQKEIYRVILPPLDSPDKEARIQLLRVKVV
jgi:hypothetical protein